MCIVGWYICFNYGNVEHGNIDDKLIALFGVFLFVGSANLFLRVLTHKVKKVVSPHLGAGRADAIEFVLRVVGYVVIILLTLRMLEVPVGRLLLGSAVLGIILGVAAQQALGNFFASIVLIISHPFTVGEQIVLNSGSLGGKYTGRVIDIGLTHTKLLEESGTVVFLPNTAVLSGAAIISSRRKRKTEKASDTKPAEENTELFVKSETK